MKRKLKQIVSALLVAILLAVSPIGDFVGLNMMAAASSDDYYDKYGISEEDLYHFYSHELIDNEVYYHFSDRVGGILNTAANSNNSIKVLVSNLLGDGADIAYTNIASALGFGTSYQEQAYNAVVLEIATVLSANEDMFLDIAESVNSAVDKAISALDYAFTVAELADSLENVDGLSRTKISTIVNAVDDSNLFENAGIAVSVVDYVLQAARIEATNARVYDYIYDVLKEEHKEAAAAALKMKQRYDNDIASRAVNMYCSEALFNDIIGAMLSKNSLFAIVDVCCALFKTGLSLFNAYPDARDILGATICGEIGMCMRSQLSSYALQGTKTQLSDSDIIHCHMAYEVYRAALSVGYSYCAKITKGNTATQNKSYANIYKTKFTYDSYIEMCIKNVRADIDSGKIKEVHVPSAPATPDTNDDDTYEKAIFPMKNLRISQGINNDYSHKNRLALDICGADSGIENLYAPFDCVVKRTYGSDHVVWIESVNPVVYADGSKDHMTIMLMHDNDISDLYVGRTIKKGEVFYQEGTAGNATGNHVHIECGRGKFYGTGWYKNSAGKWCINNSVNPFDALALSDDTIVYNGYGYNWRRVSEVIGSGTSGGTVSASPSPQNLGDNFYAYIIKTNAWTHLTVHENDNVTADTLTGMHSQIWHFKRLDNGNYLIKSLENGKYLTANGGTAHESNVCTTTASLEWIITGESANYRFIPSNSQTMALDIWNNSDESGANAQIFYYNNTMAQKFQIWYLSSPANTAQSECYIDHIPSRNLYYDSPVMTGNDVKWLQNCLSALGFETTVDGSYGPLTKSAVAAFQSANGLESDGMAGPLTQAKLKELLLPQGNTLTAENAAVRMGSFAKVTAMSTNGINIRNYNFHVINPDGTDDYYPRGTDNVFMFYPSQGPGVYKVYCTMNNDCGRYQDASNYCEIAVTYDLSPATVSVLSTFTYTGEEICPDFTVTLGNETLTGNSDYTYEYVDNVFAGMPGIVITGVNDYSGVIVQPFEIAKIPHTDLVYTCTQPTYAGENTLPDITVKFRDIVLSKDQDYIFKVIDNDFVTMNGTVTLELIGNFSGSTELEYKIAPKDISTVAIDAIPNQTYSGDYVTPAITVRDGTDILVAGTHYTASYSNNFKAGTATVTVTGKGCYTGTKSTTFNIIGKSINDLTISSIPDQTYTGSAITPGVTIMNGSVTLKEGVSYSLSYSNNINAGTASVTIICKDNFTGTKVVNFNIVARSVSGATVSAIADQTYTGSAIKPSVTVKMGSRTLTNGTDYTVAYSNNTNIGTATITITGKGNYTGTKTVTFNIVAPPVLKPEISVTAGEGSATITWDAVDDATNYRVFSYLNGKYAVLGETTSTSYTATGLTGGTKYGFLVRALVNGAWTAFTNDDLVYATPTAPAVTKPVVTATAGTQQVALKWNAVTGATKYNVYSYTTGYKLLATVTDTSYTATGLTGGTKYGFLVRAYVNGAWTAFTNDDLVYATPTAPAVTKPVVTATAGTQQVALKWNAVTGATKYNVYIYTTGYKLLATVTDTSYTATGLTAGTKYGFLVRAVVNGVQTAFTNDDLVYATPAAPAVTKPVVTATAGTQQVALKWYAVPGATKYNVYSYTTGYKLLTATTETSYTATGLTAGTKYGFLVRAYVNGAWTAFTNADLVYATPTAPAVTKPVVIATAGTQQVSLEWDAVTGATSYNVYIYTTGYKLLTTTTSTSYTATGLTAGTKYGFLVRALVNGTWTAFTNADLVYATPTAPAVTKPALTVTPMEGEALLRWNAVSGATNYRVFTYLNGKYTEIGTTTSVIYIASDLTSGTKYGFLVRAYVNGAWTAFTTDDVSYATIL